MGQRRFRVDVIQRVEIDRCSRRDNNINLVTSCKTIYLLEEKIGVILKLTNYPGFARLYLQECFVFIAL